VSLRADLDMVMNRKIFGPAQNQIPAVQPVTILTATLHKVRLKKNRRQM
jgi:hypothetical protein